MTSHMIEFQYFFIHDIIVNKYWLHKWKLSDNSICRLCDRNEETIYHMFWHCPKIKTFWFHFNSHFKKFTEKVEMRDVFLGRDDISENVVIQYAKKYIFSSILKEEYPIMLNFLCTLKHEMNIERYVSIKCSKLEQWLTRWDKVLVND